MMALKLDYDDINWNDPEVAAALKRYRESIDAASPLVKGREKEFVPKEKEARQKDFFAALKNFRTQ